MQPDYDKFPQIPPNCRLNYNAKSNLYQVYREQRTRDPNTGAIKVVRETIGSIRNGVFTFGQTYLSQEEIRRKDAEITLLRKQLSELMSGADVRLTEQTEKQAPAILDTIKTAASDSSLEPRRKKSILVPMADIALVSLMSALCGNTDAQSIADFAHNHAEFLGRYFPEFDSVHMTRDTVRRALLLAKTEAMGDFYMRLTQALVRKGAERVIPVDGQAVRATGRRSKDNPDVHSASMLMNIFDANARVCLVHRLIPKITNEMTVGPELLAGLDVRGAVVTADAMNCQVRFVTRVLTSGADYLISLKGNQDKTNSEAINLFATTHEDQIVTHQGEVELAHGRIEQRTIEILPGRLASTMLREKWQGLESGSFVRMRKVVTNKKTEQTSDEYSYYVTSLPCSQDCAQRILSVVRAHWTIENNLHWVLDVYWNQDRMQASNANYISNRSLLNKLALALLEHYRVWLYDKGLVPDNRDLSIPALQARCANPKYAIECLAAGFKYI